MQSTSVLFYSVLGQVKNRTHEGNLAIVASAKEDPRLDELIHFITHHLGRTVMCHKDLLPKLGEKNQSSAEQVCDACKLLKAIDYIVIQDMNEYKHYDYWFRMDRPAMCISRRKLPQFIFYMTKDQYLDAVCQLDQNRPSCKAFCQGRCTRPDPELTYFSDRGEPKCETVDCAADTKTLDQLHPEWVMHSQPPQRSIDKRPNSHDPLEKCFVVFDSMPKLDPALVPDKASPHQTIQLFKQIMSHRNRLTFL